MENLQSTITKAQGSDFEAYGTLVQRFQGMACGYAYSILGDFHLAEDAAQDWDRADGLYDHMGKGQYLYGFRAFKQWAEDLGRYNEWTEKERELLFFVNWWCLDNVIDARMAAVEFLRSHLDDVSGAAKDALAHAISLYQEEIDLLHGSSFERKEAFFGPWAPQGMAGWTPEVRQQEQALLLKAMDIEASAVEQLRICCKD